MQNLKLINKALECLILVDTEKMDPHTLFHIQDTIFNLYYIKSHIEKKE